ncbi:hypothetical protein [Streptomyces sp. NPDC046712]|uniref:hypothetical protein n=1 Tax=Streptomyces sp. NPDC046712 TaxID=3154802 RepID=UPI0033F33F62
MLSRMLERERPSSAQYRWGLGGLILLVLISVIAYENLQSIFNEEKDFVIGTLFSLAGFCFAKAVTRSRGDQALEILRDTGAFEQIALVDRNIKAAADRLAGYHDLQCRDPEFYRNIGVLRVALDDIDKSLTNIADLRKALDIDEGEAYPVPPELRLALLSVRRNVHEALVRRDQAYEWLRARIPHDDQEPWDLFAVMTTDIQKASLTLESLLSKYVGFPPAEYARNVLDYLRAARRRARSFREAAPETPGIFAVLEEDVEHAIRDLETVERQLSGTTAPPTTPAPDPAPVPSPAPAPSPAS